MNKPVIEGREVRQFQAGELRSAVGPNGEKLITGYAAVFEELSLDLGGFREKIRKGAFAKTIQEADVRGLWNHNSDYVLGRTKSGTLKLVEDDRGLKIDLTPPDTQWARDLMVSIDRGDVSQMSFAFETVRDEWADLGNNAWERTLIEVRLFDVSPVTYPAYVGTAVALRSAFEKAGIENLEELGKAITRTAAGNSSEADKVLIENALTALQRCATPVETPTAPVQADHPGGENEQNGQEFVSEQLRRLQVLRAR